MTETALNEQDRIERLEQLREQNLALEQEADLLRKFVASMARLVEAVERPPSGESEALADVGVV